MLRFSFSFGGCECLAPCVVLCTYKSIRNINDYANNLSRRWSQLFCFNFCNYSIRFLQTVKSKSSEEGERKLLSVKVPPAHPWPRTNLRLLGRHYVTSNRRFGRKHWSKVNIETTSKQHRHECDRSICRVKNFFVVFHCCYRWLDCITSIELILISKRNQTDVIAKVRDTYYCSVT